MSKAKAAPWARGEDLLLERTDDLARLSSRLEHAFELFSKAQSEAQAGSGEARPPSMSFRMSLAGPRPEFDASQARHLVRFSAIELQGYLNATLGDPSHPWRNVNLWLSAAEATPIREHQHKFEDAPWPMEGTIWQLWNEQNFWVSLDGNFYSAYPLDN